MTPPTPTAPVLLVLAPNTAADALRPAADLLREFGVGCREARLTEEGGANVAEARGLVAGARMTIVASVDGVAPGWLAATAVPVIRVPVAGVDPVVAGLALLTPAGDGAGFATVAIGEAGAKNAALLVVSILAAQGDARLRDAWAEYRRAQTEAVLSQTLPG